MTDIRLISIVPAPGVSQSGNISQGSSGAGGVFVNFPPGSILSGYIVNRDASGNPVLRTDTGDLTFQSKLFLKIGTEITLRIENRGGNLLAHLLTVNGQPPEALAAEQTADSDSAAVILPKFSDLEQKSAGGAPPAPPRTLQPHTAEPAVIRNAPTIAVSGVLLTPPDAAEPDAPELPPQLFRIVNLQTPENPTQQTAYAAYARAAGTPTPLVTPPATSTPAQTAPATPQPLQTGQIFTAPVIAVETTGEPLIQTPAGIVRLQGTQLPQGAQVTLEVLPPQNRAPLPPLPPAPLPELAKQWTSLQQITTLLATHSGAPMPPWFAALNASKTNVTHAEHVSSGLMVFVTALRGGSFSNWLSDDTVQWLHKNGHEPLLKKADAEFMTLVRAFTEPTAQSNQWQSLFFPVAVDGGWQQVRMFLKRDRRQNKKISGTHDDDTRFIVEMTLSQLGELQLDGLVHRATGQVHFDLFIRSLSPLEAAIQHDIQRIYSDMGAITGYKGQLAFQAVREFPVNPMKEAMAQSGGVVA